MNKIYIVLGSKKDFMSFLDQKIGKKEYTAFISIIRDYNAKLRPNSSWDDEEREIYEVENLVVKEDDYGSVLEHVINNFVNVVTINHDVDNLFLHNPPKKVIDSMEAIYGGIIEFVYTDYKIIDRDVIKQAYSQLRTTIIGQDNAKRQVVSTMYKQVSDAHEKPVVLMLLGPSGIGKTETAKCISDALGGDLLRVQFSMMQSQEAYNYVFGGEHAKNSLARDLLGRETNIILIDEFDKVNPIFFNAFYQLFDEGWYKDTHYMVDLRKTVFFCTTNFQSEDEAAHILGMPIYSRFDGMIKYEYLSVPEKKTILERIYAECMARLQTDEKVLFENEKIYNWFLGNLERFDNVRLLRNKLEDAIYQAIFDKFIKCDNN